MEKNYIAENIANISIFLHLDVYIFILSVHNFNRERRLIYGCMFIND